MWYSEKGKWFELFCRVCLYTLQCAVKELHYRVFLFTPPLFLISAVVTL